MKIIKIIAILITVVATSFAAKDKLTDGSQAFTAKFLKQAATNTPKQNVIFSPLGMQILMALLTAASPNITTPAIDEVITVMELPLQNTIHEQFKKLIDAIETPDYDLKYFDANKMYFDDGCTIKEEFIKRANNFYRAGIEVIDFKNGATAANKINKWVKGETDNKIQNLITTDKISPDTKFIFISALYIRGKWTKSFNNEDSKYELFTSGPGMTMVKMMKSSRRSYEYFEDNQAQYLKLDLLGSNVDAYMVIVLPLKVNGLEDLVQNHLETTLNSHPFYPAGVTVSLPAFKLTTYLPVKSILQQLGLSKIFEDGVVLNDVNCKGNDGLTDVFHRTAIGIDESGVTLVSGSGARGGNDAENLPQKEIYARHPFLYYIKIDDVIVSAGQIYKP